MTAYRFVTLTCDGCGEIHDDGQSLTAAKARASAKSGGWTQPNRGEDRCGQCNGTHVDYGHGARRRIEPTDSTNGATS